MHVDPKLYWYVARASGITTWALVSLSVIWGLLLSTRAAGKAARPAWLTDLHRHLGGLAIVFLGVHLGGLALDKTVSFGPSELFVPFASKWQPGAVAWGIVAMYLLLAIEITSLLMKRIPRRLWKAVHFSSFAVYVTGTIHLLASGTDSSNVLLRDPVVVVTALVAFLTALRILNARAVRLAAVEGAVDDRAAKLARARERSAARAS